MRQFTRDERYRVLKSADEIRDLYEKIKDSEYRQEYHIQPVTGLSSDPNGFVKHGDTWHLFYQWTPWGAVHGLKYWYHVTSEDLVHWKNEGIGLAADTEYDNKGVHSGSAYSADDELYLFYTGNHRDENWVRTPYTCAAELRSDGTAAKLSKPLFGPHPDYTEHQRDPKIFWSQEKNKFYIFIGAQNKELQGKILVYSSDRLLEGWKFEGELKVPGYEAFGGMWECPSIEHICGKDLLIFSPQYMKYPGRGESTNHNGYMVGRMDFDTLTFTPEREFTLLDYGFDFYAAQCASGVNAEDHAVLIAWIGLPDNHYPTEEEDWEGSQSMCRIITIDENNRLIQRPAEALKSLRISSGKADGTLPHACELDIDVSDGDFDLNLFTKEDGSGGLRMHYNSAELCFTVDKSPLDMRFNEKVFEQAYLPVFTPLRKLEVFIDRSSVEIFCNGGESTFTAHVFPTEREHFYTVSDGAEVTVYELKKAVTDEFKV
ncbi:MAG: sucrose-6-phosphate hydrolase [Solobacterium sp.]|nr:sucrose-6-phosphate hydrolase [Solobacterium sp.]